MRNMVARLSGNKRQRQVDTAHPRQTNPAMVYASLRDFMDRLEKSGRLKRVSAPVTPFLEMTEIQTRLLAEQGPAVLFENVVRPEGRATAMPVLVNLFGTV